MKKAPTQDGMTRFNRISAPANAIFSVFFVLLAFVCVAPLIFVIIISLSSDNSIQQIGYALIPMEWSAYSYTYLLNSADTIGRAFVVSIGVTVAGTVIGLVLNASMGYVLSRSNFIFKKAFTILVFIPMIFSGGLVASYLINTQVLQLGNTYWALILPIAVSPFYIIILRTFFNTTVPDSVIESARIDGASQFLTFFKIVLPISLPALATIGLFLSFAYWNDWFMAMMYIKSDHAHMYPLQYVLVRIQRQLEFLARNSQYMSTDISASSIPLESVRMALVVVVVMPIACSYPFFQRYFISGLTIGAVKG